MWLYLFCQRYKFYLKFVKSDIHLQCHAILQELTELLTSLKALKLRRSEVYRWHPKLFRRTMYEDFSTKGGSEWRATRRDNP